MRRPIHNLRIAVGVFLCGSAGMLASLVVPMEAMSLFVQDLLPGAAGLVTAAGFVAALVLYPFARSYSRLRSGASVVARWVVSKPREVEVIVADDAICIGPDFFHMPFSAKVRIRGDVLEFDQFIFSRFGGHHDVLRVPIAAGAETSAARVIEQRRAAYPAAVKRFRRKALAALVIVVLTAGAWLLVFGSGL